MELNDLSTPLLTRTEAAIILNCSVPSIKRYEKYKTDPLESQKVGPKSVRISKGAILAFLLSGIGKSHNCRSNCPCGKLAPRNLLGERSGKQKSGKRSKGDSKN